MSAKLTRKPLQHSAQLNNYAYDLTLPVLTECSVKISVQGKKYHPVVGVFVLFVFPVIVAFCHKH